MLESASYPFVHLHCERVLIGQYHHQSHDDHNNHQDHHHKPRIQFRINPISNHSEHYYRSSPDRIGSRDPELPIDTAIVGPTIELDLAEFLAHAPGDDDDDPALMAMLSGLQVSRLTKHEIIRRIIDQAMVSIADMGGLFKVGEEKFHLIKASVKLHVSTFHARDDYDDDDGDDFDGLTPAAEEAIERLERVRVDEEMKERECSICLEDYVGESEACRLGCSHLFHGHCLRAWLEKSHYCPLCRFELPVRVSST